ncbi:LacI family DNA-binding transcriptional regulator [Paenibacillus arenilitoris]|uniref:LacI family DNA-binding transcriptional regulator n=1 Tax=Paenibacillus arenilitoris TaxID=2772299 RepID=A0A927CJZ0_9BACL|nr:LacI family DNA-binding transcriptional regulator [Paenibacillus arenilitoris]MBD2868914.1 LacI family DNA-binding transcriptional regulator [Paenibacillus arenilitoris]
MPIKKKITLQHIAAELGLTVHTVSKALRGLPGMSESTRASVRELARKLGYHTKEQERSALFERVPLYFSHSRRFVFLIASEIGMYSALHNALLESVQRRLADAGHKVELSFITDRLREDEAFEAWVDKTGIAFSDGVFISPNIPYPVEDKLMALPVPRILLNFPPAMARVDSVIWNVGDAMRQCVNYLLECGHRRLMYIGDIERTRGYRIRWSSFRSTLEEAGIAASLEGHLFETNGTREEWAARWQRLVEAHKPTAFVCTSQEALTRTYLACSMTGSGIPEHYSLVALEAEPALRGLLPDMTRPALPVQETGFRAAERMLWRIANPSAPYEHIVLQGDLIHGTTVRSIR